MWLSSYLLKIDFTQQSKYLHRYYVFKKFSFSPSKVTKNYFPCQVPFPTILTSLSGRFDRIFLSVFHDKDTVPPQEFRIDCMFPCQTAAKRALCAILSTNYTAFAVYIPNDFKSTTLRVSIQNRVYSFEAPLNLLCHESEFHLPCSNKMHEQALTNK